MKYKYLEEDGPPVISYPWVMHDMFGEDWMPEKGYRYALWLCRQRLNKYFSIPPETKKIQFKLTPNKKGIWMLKTRYGNEISVFRLENKHFREKRTLVYRDPVWPVKADIRCDIECICK